MRPPTTFKALFCQNENCPEQEFERRVFWRCVNRHAFLVALLIHKLDAVFFQEDLEFIREAGASTNTSELIGELNRFYGRNLRDRSWLRRSFAIRVSGNRVLRLWRQLTNEEEE